MKQTTRSFVAEVGGDFSAALLDSEERVFTQAVAYALGDFHRDVLPENREYERASTSCVNACLMSVVNPYLN